MASLAKYHRKKKIISQAKSQLAKALKESRNIGMSKKTVSVSMAGGSLAQWLAKACGVYGIIGLENNHIGEMSQLCVVICENESENDGEISANNIATRSGMAIMKISGMAAKWWRKRAYLMAWQHQNGISENGISGKLS
jgi:hypothetical protein